MALDDIDKRLINIAQLEFPLTGEPFAALGMELGIDAVEAMEKVGDLKASGIIRYIGPLFDANALGYQTTLVAMRIAEHRIDEATRAIVEHPGISHAYLREHQLNLWFTLAAPLAALREAEIQRLASTISTNAVFDLPALRVFKLRTYFDATGGQMPTPPDKGAVERDVTGNPPDLLPMDRAVIREVQQDLPIVARPFDLMAEPARLPTDEFVACCLVMLRRGVMRRYSATVRHTALGMAANALVCWKVPPAEVEAVGKRLADLDQVSHCYVRRSYPLWPYNLYAMIHGQTSEECTSIVAEASHQSSIEDYVMLFSSRELKKTRVKYTV